MTRDIYHPSSGRSSGFRLASSGSETSLAAPTDRPAPIHGVPLDVLEEIFTSLINSLILGVDDYHGDRFPFSMLTISHVHTSAAIASLRTQAHRWRELYISFVPSEFKDFPKLLTGLRNLASLKRLTCVKPFDVWKFRAFTTAPNLRWLDLGEYVRPGKTSSPFPYAQIHHLILRSLDFQSTSLFPNVTDVTMYGTPPQHFLLPSPASASNLVSLTICLTYFTQEHLPLYRRNVALPRLRDLTIIYVGPVRNPFKAQYLTRDLITVFSHRIQHLTLWRVPICVKDLIAILEPLTELRHLGIHDPLPPVCRPYCPISHELIRRLATDPLFLPHVNSLDLRWQWHDVDGGMVMDMLLYRTGSTRFAMPYVPPSYLNGLIEQMRHWVI
ncbi:hypothetical protein DFS33DRAFT_1387886 [Desarmillaria ectypa]|nr:hypothetical protein DFS33DRAFT_1387886 [Desarmillaria ectypa]